jgi:hypothetical protein
MNDQYRSTLTYTKAGDYYIPNLILDDQPDKEIGMYGRMRGRTWRSIILAGTVSGLKRKK